MSRMLLFSLVVVLTLLILTQTAFAAAPYTISDNATGGDCTQIGVWDNAAKTCTLNQDIPISGGINAIIIGSNNIILDGAGHVISGTDAGTGVLVSGMTAVSVRNLNLSHLFAGISFNAGSGGTISYNSLSNNANGISLNDTNLNTVSHNDVTASSIDQIAITGTSIANIVDSNNVMNSSAEAGIELNASSNIIRFNLISNNSTTSKAAIYITGSTNTVFSNTISNNNQGLGLWSSSNGNAIFNNNFLNNTVQTAGTGTGNTFNSPAPVGGNYWSEHATVSQGCDNADNDRFCDAPYTPPFSGVTDNLPLARRGYFFTWYDMASAGAQDWVLMANPIEAAGEDAWFDLSIAGVPQTLPTISQIPGQVPPLGAITPTYPGTINGPVDVGYHARMRTMVSQRILWGNSLEEVVGTDAALLSDHYYWTWYDQSSTGFSNWIMVGNPSATETVTVDLNFRDVGTGLDVTEIHDISPGGSWTPAYPGKMGGPVEIKAYIQSGSWINPGDRRDVVASQRVLSNGGTAFNEVPGIPAEELTDRYMWTWYDNVYGLNWIMIANPPDSGYNMDYSIFIHGVGEGGGVDLAPGQTATVMIPGKVDGPVEVLTARHNSGIPLNSVVSQRTLWGPSFEEVPGFPYSSLSSLYYWTWYDQQSAGVSNWVQVANPDGVNPLHYEITIAGQDPAPGPTCSKGTLAAGAVMNCQFQGTMNGPVKVQAWNLIKTAPMDIIASQRVLWNGYFNEVMGTELS